MEPDSYVVDWSALTSGLGIVGLLIAVWLAVGLLKQFFGGKG